MRHPDQGVRHPEDKINVNDSGNYLSVLRMVGSVLIVIGLADIAFMVYAVMTWGSISSSVNIFAIIAGVILIRGSLKTALRISVYTATLIVAIICTPVPVLFIFPLDLLFAYVRFLPQQSMIVTIYALVMSGAVIWTHLKLTSEPVRTAITNQNINLRGFVKTPRQGYIFGVTALAIGILSLFFINNSDAKKEAIRRAKIEFGQDYSFFVTSWSSSPGTSGRHYYAAMKAYNEYEMKDVYVEWDD